MILRNKGGFGSRGSSARRNEMSIIPDSHLEGDVKSYLESFLSDSALIHNSTLQLKVSEQNVQILYWLTRMDADISDEPVISITLDLSGTSDVSSSLPFEGARVLEFKYSHFDLSSAISSEMTYGAWRYMRGSQWAIAETSRNLRFGDPEFIKLLGACYKHAITLSDWYSSSSFDVDEDDGNYRSDPRTFYPFKKRTENRRFR